MRLLHLLALESSSKLSEGTDYPLCIKSGLGPFSGRTIKIVYAKISPSRLFVGPRNLFFFHGFKRSPPTSITMSIEGELVQVHPESIWEMDQKANCFQSYGMFQAYSEVAGLCNVPGLMWHRLSVHGESASVSVDGFSAWSGSHISSGAHPPLRTYFANLITRIGIVPFQLIPSSYRLLARVPSLQLSFQLLDELPLWSVRTEEIPRKEGQYRAFSEEQLKVPVHQEEVMEPSASSVPQVSVACPGGIRGDLTRGSDDSWDGPIFLSMGASSQSTRKGSESSSDPIAKKAKSLVPELGIVASQYTPPQPISRAEMINNIGRSVSKLTSEKWAVSNSVDLFTLSVATKQQATRLALFTERAAKEAGNAKTQVASGTHMSREEWKAKLITEEEKWYAKYLKKYSDYKAQIEQEAVRSVEKVEKKINSLQEDMRKKDSRIKDLKDEVKEGKKQVAVWEVKKVLSMSRGKYLEEFPLMVDIDNDKGISVVALSSQEYVETEVSFAQADEGPTQDAAEADLEPEEQFDVPAPTVGLPDFGQEPSLWVLGKLGRFFTGQDHQYPRVLLLSLVTPRAESGYSSFYHLVGPETSREFLWLVGFAGLQLLLQHGPKDFVDGFHLSISLWPGYNREAFHDSVLGTEIGHWYPYARLLSDTRQRSDSTPVENHCKYSPIGPRTVGCLRAIVPMGRKKSSLSTGFDKIGALQLRAATRLITLWTSLCFLGEGMSRKALIFSGLAFIPRALTMYPKNSPKAMGHSIIMKLECLNALALLSPLRVIGSWIFPMGIKASPLKPCNRTRHGVRSASVNSITWNANLNKTLTELPLSARILETLFLVICASITKGSLVGKRTFLSSSSVKLDGVHPIVATCLSTGGGAILGGYGVPSSEANKATPAVAGRAGRARKKVKSCAQPRFRGLPSVYISAVESWLLRSRINPFL
uniref:Uncharacterized protein n=1 Tax=Cannabis sativa TaxID=3483 RepID=A0A803QD50_CANSA